MVTTLVLVRHAKSDWGDAALDDHDRPLAERGVRDAPTMAERLAATGLRPDTVLSSTARRARATADYFAARFGVAVTLDPALYAAPARTLLAPVAAHGGRTVIVVAHDPGMSMLAEQLSRGAIVHMPTCAVARFTWHTDDGQVATALDPDDWAFDSPRDGDG